MLRLGEPVLLFPEGRPSSDGAVGPLRRGLGALVRRGQVRGLLPIGIAYDELTTGRRRAVLAIDPLIAAEGADSEEIALRAMRHALPLTCGQAAAARLLAAAEAGERRLPRSALERALAAAVEESRAEGRQMERSLLDARGRGERLSECLRALAAAGVLTPSGRGAVTLDAPRITAHPALRRAAREHASARER
jgi:hypothetical protein